VLSFRAFVERVLVDSGLHEHYRTDKSDPDGERLANLGELVSSAQQFETDLAAADGDLPSLAERLGAYLEQVSLVSDVDSVSPDQGAVTLMTLHAAKGLEFPVVALIGAEDGLLPHSRAQTSPSEMEEERRLCFVGITRAQRMLLVTHARYRTIFGQTTPTIPSRFLQEFPAKFVQAEDVSEEESWTAGEDRFSEMSRLRENARSETAQFPPGTLVRHPQFGLGRVLTINAYGAQTRAQVAFNTAGVKTLILQYANLERV
jgi:DNA helicase-2/ATP-dependent DNA helicase PcrA